MVERLSDRNQNLCDTGSGQGFGYRMGWPYWEAPYWPAERPAAVPSSAALSDWSVAILTYAVAQQSF